MKPIIILCFFLINQTIGYTQPKVLVYKYLNASTTVYFSVDPSYKLRALIDLELNEKQLISTGISDTPTVSINEQTMATGINSFYKDALLLTAYNFTNNQIDWNLTLPAQEIHRAKTLLLNDTFYTAVSFTGKMIVNGVEIEGSEEINALLIKTTQKGELHSYKLINGLSFSDFSANDNQLFFAGWYKYHFKLDGVNYENEMGKTFENNRFYAAYNKAFNQQWVQVASHPVKPHHNDPFHWNNQLKLVHVSDDKLYLASLTFGLDPLVLGKDTILTPTTDVVNLLHPYWYNTYRILTLNTKDGSLSKYDCFYSRNVSGIYFFYDESTDEVKTLVGRDSIIFPQHGSNAGRDYKLYANGQFIDFENEHYLKIKFSELYEGLKIEATGLDYGQIHLISENEGCQTQQLYYNRTLYDEESFLSKKLLSTKPHQSYMFFKDANDNYTYIRSNFKGHMQFINILPSNAFLQNEYFTAYYEQSSDHPFAKPNEDVIFYEPRQLTQACEPTTQIFIPNAITPNGDGINDSLSLAPQDFKSLHWQIFARNGTLVYEGSGAWDGSFKGKTQAGSFTYILKATTLNGAEINKKGSIMVIR